uniref:Tripartite motif-containing protein 16-like protein n=1 Tax=Sinocyclocheilus grahami TaxID=75366 RepID=A0A672LU98_SINGR
MFQQRIQFSQGELSCTVCLDLLKDPVTIQCGHSYCENCITDRWDHEDQMRVYSCPQCRQTFSPRPALATNTMLADLVEKLKKTKLPADCYAGAGDVQCEVFCTGRKYKAIKSCLVCQESYCQTHFDGHEEFHSRKPHKVIDATGRLQEMICQKHEKHLEMYCITDQQCICELCTKYEHKNHETVSAAAQRTEKQKQLKETQKTSQQREKDLQQLREAVESHKRSAQTAVEDNERIFTELIRSIESSCSELVRLLIPDIRDQEKAAMSQAEGRLEQEINDLRRRDTELEQLSHTQDHIQYLQVTGHRSPGGRRSGGRTGGGMEGQFPVELQDLETEAEPVEQEVRAEEGKLKTTRTEQAKLKTKSAELVDLKSTRVELRTTTAEQTGPKIPMVELMVLRTTLVELIVQKTPLRIRRDCNREYRDVNNGLCGCNRTDRQFRDGIIGHNRASREFWNVLLGHDRTG